MFRRLAPALVAPLLLTTACATRADQDAIRVDAGAGVEALRAAPVAVEDAGTASFEMVMTFSGVPGFADEAGDVLATGVLDADAEQMAMEMDLGALFGGLPEGLDEPAQIVVDGGTFYLRMPMLQDILGTSGWLSMTPEDLGQSAGSLGLGTGAFDPAQLLEVLRGAADGVDVVGQEDVRGVPTTRYRATIDLADSLTRLPAEERAQLESMLGDADVSVPVEAWIDGDGLPRRISMDLVGALADAGLGDRASMEMRIELFDYGDPVHVDVPSPDEVTPFADVMGGGFMGEAS